MAQITRRVILEMTGTDADGKVRTLNIPEQRRYADVGLDRNMGAGKTQCISTGHVRWLHEEPYEIWVPAERIGEWRLLHEEPPPDAPKEPPYA